MRNSIFFIIVVIPLYFTGCDSSKRSEEVASYQYEEKKVEMSHELRTMVPDWVVEGKICYGLVVQIDKDSNRVKGKPVKSKIVLISENYVKMKALETVNLNEIEGCAKMAIAKGQTWDEKEGDFYLTLQDAIDALKEQNLYNIE